MGALSSASGSIVAQCAVEEVVAGGEMVMTEENLRFLHYLIMAAYCSDEAGRYANRERFVCNNLLGHRYPSPGEVPDMVREFLGWLNSQPDTRETAHQAHDRLIRIHPFNDGNGRVARLLMSLILIRGRHTKNIHVSLRDPMDQPRVMHVSIS
jgi:Fic family protein